MNLFLTKQRKFQLKHHETQVVYELHTFRTVVWKPNKEHCNLKIERPKKKKSWIFFFNLEQQKQKKKYLGNKCSSWSQKFTRKFQSVQSQLGLSERIMKPGATHVWRTIVQHNVNFPFTQMTLQFSTTIFQKEFWFNFLKEKQKQIKIKFKKNPK